MNLKEWFPLYSEICNSLSIDPVSDFIASVRLSSMIGPRNIDIPEEFKDREVSIFGPSLNIREATGRNDLIIVADSGIEKFLSIYRRNPDIIVTDLDGGIPLIKRCNEEGTFLFLHVHGDNMHLVREFVPNLNANFICTTQNFPLHNVMNYYGFTDGDRAVFISMAMKASSVTIHGFDFCSPVIKPSIDLERKKKKLKIASSLVSMADREMKSRGLSGVRFFDNNVRV
jgi:uncharacterized Rossmann fold enzyme